MYSCCSFRTTFQNKSYVALYIVSVCFSVLGGQESRGVLRKISDMLEVIMKRMDALSKLSNTTDTHRLDELSSALDRYCILVSNAFFYLYCQSNADVTCLIKLVSEEGIFCRKISRNCSWLVKKALSSHKEHFSKSVCQAKVKEADPWCCVYFNEISVFLRSVCASGPVQGILE